jgi:hypothetical protein
MDKENSPTCKFVEQTFKLEGPNALLIKFKLLKHLSSLIELVIQTMEIFNNFKYFGRLCAITCEEAKDIQS